MQFGRADVFELLCNVYKANRDLVDWSGFKPLDYSKQSTSVSAATFSKIKAKKKSAGEKDSGFLRIGSLNVRVKKTTEAFSNFLGVGNGHTLSHAATANRPHQRSHRHHLQGHRHLPQSGTTMRNPMMGKTKPSGFATSLHHKGSSSSNSKKQNIESRASVPFNMNNLTHQFEKLHKSWGSADNIHKQKKDDDNNVNDKTIMPPPKNIDTLIKRRQKSVTTPTTTRSSVTSSIATDSPRGSISSTNSSTNFIAGYSSMPTTPNQQRAPSGRVQSDMVMDSDSDSACGFDSSWSMSGRTSMSSGNLQSSQSQC
ncbi:uncharacterized protein [Eurosta solidaginis]|uniref:uncharacterized protein n=1 Tax=Eurosta solidaginis TaxID=178769 RepID=UPI003530D4C2